MDAEDRNPSVGAQARVGVVENSQQGHVTDLAGLRWLLGASRWVSLAQHSATDLTWGTGLAPGPAFSLGIPPQSARAWGRILSLPAFEESPRGQTQLSEPPHLYLQVVTGDPPLRARGESGGAAQGETLEELLVIFWAKFKFSVGHGQPRVISLPPPAAPKATCSALPAAGSATSRPVLFPRPGHLCFSRLAWGEGNKSDLPEPGSGVPPVPGRVGVWPWLGRPSILPGQFQAAPLP